ncbi:hypothetical protein [Mesorhizobium sp. B2-3-5]|uniref:hypothetical protein n=1 Tax=Mesorhizobium sp. B2-3-5 TaxID=2589958 RepID=UPI00112DC0D6|nr:hypothetical protein [Mesorhizobium sp. B2-3-5]TPM34486.1 hypothetical protein FJ958_09010 [Mesorhizobium sp. B2-3-5]
MKAIGLALGFLMLSAPPAPAEEPIEWTVSTSGGSKIEIPVFFADGDARLLGGFAENLGTAFEPKEYPGVQLRQYRAGTRKKSPFEYISAELVGNTDNVTYKLDKPSLAAISGTGIFYGMCQKTRYCHLFRHGLGQERSRDVQANCRTHRPVIS